jgi:thiol-disulfide isomerase/thioredoxin
MRLKHLIGFLGGVTVALVGCLSAQTYEDILADPASWPAEIEVKSATKGGLLQGEKVTGAMLVGTGRKLTVLKLRPDGIVVRIGSATVLLAPEKTNLVTAPAPEPAAAAPVSAPVPRSGKSAAVDAVPPRPSAPPTAIQRLLLGRLVQLENGTLKSFDMRKLNGVKFYGIMFSAGWCGPCREFAPHLLESYRSLRNIYPEFELVLVSNDRSPADMLAYMRDENMPWPAIKYSELGQVDEITRLGGPGIPCLVLIDGDGQVLAHSFKGREYLGPDSVLDATWRVLKKSRHG